MDGFLYQISFTFLSNEGVRRQPLVNRIFNPPVFSFLFLP
jgi:hypothetical protein